MDLMSTGFTAGADMPRQYTCEGADLAPPLSWSGVPDGARSLALIVDDPDAPDPAAPKMTWVHWVLFDIPPAQAVLAYDIAGGMTLREHAAERGVPVETARSRLKAVMARLGCRRQAELAALLARLPALS